MAGRWGCWNTANNDAEGYYLHVKVLQRDAQLGGAPMNGVVKGSCWFSMPKEIRQYKKTIQQGNSIPLSKEP